MRKPPATPHVLDVPEVLVSCTTASQPPFRIPISQRSLDLKIDDLSRIVDGTYYAISLGYIVSVIGRVVGAGARNGRCRGTRRS